MSSSCSGSPASLVETARPERHNEHGETQGTVMMVRWMKRTAVEMLIGAVVGFTGWCLAGKSLTSMMFSSIGGTFSCQADVEAALTKFLTMQLYSALVGALLAALAIGLTRRALERRKARAAPAPAPIA
jgi:hypothetical protein